MMMQVMDQIIQQVPIVMAPAGGTGMLASAVSLFTKFAIIGGGLWTVWGVITLAGGLKDQNGSQTHSGMWQAIGGGMIVAAAALFSQVQL